MSSLPEPPAAPALVEFVIGDTCRISGRGTAAMAQGDPLPWWPIALHRVRVLQPGGAAFEADASVEVVRAASGGEKMALLFRHAEPDDLPRGSYVISLGWTPYPPKATPAPKRRWRFWE